jgi:hypothetical protein
MSLILIAFACYLAFPIKTDLLTNPTTGEIDVDISSTWLHRLNYSFAHQGISKFVSAPSMHCAHAFSIAFAFGYRELKGAWVAKALAIITIFSTVFCKPHPCGPPHQAAGILLACFAHYFFKKMETVKAFEARINAMTRLALCVLAPVILFQIGEYLAEVSGWHVNIPAMLGFDHRLPGGFNLGIYGF